MNGSILKVMLNASYGPKQVLNGVDFELAQGEVFGLVGTSGAGKSTLVLALLGLLSWRGGRSSGIVDFKGTNLLKVSERQLRKIRGNDIAIVPQSPLSALNPGVSLESHFNEAWCAHQRPQPAALRSRIEELMHEVNLPCSVDFLSRKPGQISVGQAQRVLIALALLHRPAVLIADEPTSALDPVTQTQIVSLLSRVAKRHGATVLYISHDLVSVLQLCNRVAILDNVQIVETLPTSQLSDAEHPRTQSLLAALPVPLEVLLPFLRAKQTTCDEVVPGPAKPSCAAPTEL